MEIIIIVEFCVFRKRRFLGCEIGKGLVGRASDWEVKKETKHFISTIARTSIFVVMSS